MLTLHQFPAAWDVCSASCFCAKVEAFLRWQKIPYQLESKVSLKGAPKGKVPFITDNGKVIGDSEFILSYVCDTYGVNPDGNLTVAERGVSVAIRYLCEEGLYRAMSYFRFVDEAGWQVIRQTFFAGLPGWLKPLAEWKIRGYVRKQLQQQGIARHTREEVAALAIKDMDALAAILGDKPFFFGDEMHMADLVVFSVFSNWLVPAFDNPPARHARSLGRLVVHTDRVREACFGLAFAAKDAA